MTSDSEIFIWERQNEWGTLNPQQEAEKCLRRHWEMPEYQVRRGQWSTQTHDRWGRCRDNQSKGASHLLLIQEWLHVWLHVLTLPAHLLTTFPLALAESPLSTARKFCGVTFCQKQPIRSHEFCLKPVWTLMKSTKTHFSRVVFGNAFVYVRAVGPVYQYSRGGVPVNIKNEKNKELKKADKTEMKQMNHCNNIGCSRRAQVIIYYWKQQLWACHLCTIWTIK